MTKLAALRRIDPRVVIVAVIIAAISAIFWLNPHYPSLQGRAGVDPDEMLSTPLGFETHFPEPRADQTFRRIVWSATQWGVTNKQSLVFGLLLAAGLLTMARLLARPRDETLATPPLQDILTGAPLGGCFNCAAPLARALREGEAGSTLRWRRSSPLRLST